MRYDLPGEHRPTLAEDIKYGGLLLLLALPVILAVLGAAAVFSMAFAAVFDALEAVI